MNDSAIFVRRPPRRVVWATVAILCYLVHGGFHVTRGTPHGLLWPCNLGVLLIAFGLLLRRPLPNAVGVFWLVAGTPLWIAGSIRAGVVLPTSPLTHLGGLAVGLFALRTLGLPAGSWWKAWLALPAVLVARWLALGDAVGFADSLWPDWHSVFASPPIFLFVALAFYAVAFAVAEPALSRLVTRNRASSSHGPRPDRSTAASRRCAGTTSGASGGRGNVRPNCFDNAPPES